MRLVCCTANQKNVDENVPTWFENAYYDHHLHIIADGTSVSPPPGRGAACFRLPEKVGPVGCLQAGYSLMPLNWRFATIASRDGGDEGIVTTDSILAYIHDDVQIYEKGWDTRVLKEFEDPTVGVVGFGGGTSLGTPGIYKTPYRLQQLARSGYASNVKDAEVHGDRFTGERDVAVLDGFCLIVRKSLLDEFGGWPTDKLIFHMYDFWLCSMARRYGYRVRLVGIDCHHFGGRTSTQAGYNDWVKAKYRKTDAEIHADAHEYCYEEFKDVLPFDVRSVPTRRAVTA